MKKFLKIKRIKAKGGFTLIEVLVALFIFSLSILAIMATLSKGIVNINEIKKRNVAIYLAQEQIEYLRNVRDNYMLYPSNGSWNSFTTELSAKNCFIPKNCYFNNDIVQNTKIDKTYLLTCTAPGLKCDPLKLDSSTGNYGYSIGLFSIFTRHFYYNTISSDEIKIYSIVEWEGKKIVFSENLYNWFDPGP
jgi:prepilin-type N-terminal cleavage/methylation domain-containing protein